MKDILYNFIIFRIKKKKQEQILYSVPERWLPARHQCNEFGLNISGEKCSTSPGCLPFEF